MRILTIEFKRINQFNTAVFKIPDISRRDREVSGPGDGSDLAVKIGQRTADFPAVSLDCTIKSCRSLVEWQYPGFESRGNKLFETLSQQPLSLSSGHAIQTKADFGNGDRCDVERYNILCVEPFENRIRGWCGHEFRNDVGIENDHSENSRGSDVWRSGRARSSSPYAGLNRRTAKSPSRSGVIAACLNICRISSSIDIP